MMCLYLMGLNLSNEQIAVEVDLPVNVVIQKVANMQHMTIQPLITERVASGSLIYTDDTISTMPYPHCSQPFLFQGTIQQTGPCPP
jgi:hypothetical protein